MIRKLGIAFGCLVALLVIGGNSVRVVRLRLDSAERGWLLRIEPAPAGDSD